MAIHFKNGAILLDGDKLRGCCCPTPQPCASLSFDFRYEYPNGIPTPTNPAGDHYVAGACGQHSVESYSETWGHGWGQDDDYWDEGDCHLSLSAGAQSGVGAIVTGDILLGGSGSFEFMDTRVGSNTWSVTLVAKVRVSSDAILGLRIGENTYRPPDANNWSDWFELGEWRKTNSNAVGQTYNFTIVQ